MAIFNFFKKKNMGNHDPEDTNPRGIASAATDKANDRFIIHSESLDESRIFGQTDPGKVRTNNEDFFVVAPDMGLFMVADGMGGHNAGEVASEEACKRILAYFKDSLRDIKLETGDDGGVAKKEIEDVFWAAFHEANTFILNMARENPEYRGMGTTLVMALVHGDILYVGHIGDVRAYLWHEGSFEQLTEDHSVVWQLMKAGKITKEEARLSKMKNQITQAIGIGPTVVPSFGEWTITKGDTVMLCCDGLWDMLPDEQIAEIIRANKSAKEITEHLVSAANGAGGLDNITVITYIH